MGDAEAKEALADESSRLIDSAQPFVLEMKELRSRTNAESPDVSDTDTKLNTALHSAVLSVCGNDSNRPSSLKQIYKMMNSQRRELNMPNKEGYTAIGCAVEHSHKKCVEHMLNHPLSHSLYLDYYPGDRESTVRDIVLEKFPEFQRLLPAPLMEKLNSAVGNEKLLAALQCGRFNVFHKCLDETNANPWYDEPYHSSLLEIACQMKKRTRFIKLLLDRGADPNIKNRITHMPLIHATARSGNFEVLELLLKKKETDLNVKDCKDRTFLHWLAQVRERKPGDKHTLENCFKLLLDKHSVTKIGIDFRDVSGNTALCIALERGFQDRAKLLLSAGADISAIRNGSKILLPNILSTLTEILDNCLMSNNELLTSKDLQVRLNCQLLTNIVPRIAESQHLRELLKHPVISAFLLLKWQNFRFIFFLNMLFYFTFLLFLTGYILYSETYNTLNDGGAARNNTGPLSFNDGMNDNSYLFFLRLFLMFSLILLNLRELLQFILNRRVYVKSLENWLEILLIFATFISCSGIFESGALKRHSSAVAVLLGWSELLLMLGRLPQLSVQHEMFRTVSMTFLRFMLGYFTLFIAFTLSFYILFKGSSEQRNSEMFDNLPLSLLKTIVMFTGEFEASSLLLHTQSYTSHVIFLFFVVLVAIVLLNLLNGLAVNDTEQITKVAERLSLVARVRLLCRIEGFVNLLPKCVKRYVELKEDQFVIYPNRPNIIVSSPFWSLLSIISEKAKPSKEYISTGIQEEWRMITEKLSELQFRQEKLEIKLDIKLDVLRQILVQIQTHLETLRIET